MAKTDNDLPDRTSPRFGGLEGKLLILIALAMLLSVGLMAWFSEPSDRVAVPEPAGERQPTE